MGPSTVDQVLWRRKHSSLNMRDNMRIDAAFATSGKLISNVWYFITRHHQ